MLTLARGKTSRSGVPLWRDHAAPYRQTISRLRFIYSRSWRGLQPSPREERVGSDCLLIEGQPLQPLSSTIACYGHGATRNNPEVRADPEGKEGALLVGACNCLRPSLRGATPKLMPSGGCFDGRHHVRSYVSLQRRQSPKVAERQVQTGRHLISSNFREGKERSVQTRKHGPCGRSTSRAGLPSQTSSDDAVTHGR